MGKLPYKKDWNTVLPVGKTVFDNLASLMKASEFCSQFGYSMKTIYDWKYRPERSGVPHDLIVKFRGKLFVRTDILKGLVP